MRRLQCLTRLTASNLLRSQRYKKCKRERCRTSTDRHLAEPRGAREQSPRPPWVCFAGCRFGGEQFTRAAFSSDYQATKGGIQQALKQVGAQTRPQDTLLLFLAGHGTMIGQRYYFIPQEFRKQAERLEDDVRQQGLPADEFSDYLGAAAALKRILILDTCASGGALEVALKARAGFELRGAIERLSRSQGIFTIAASAASEQAQEVKELGHGVLSYALLAGLGAVRGGPLVDKHAQPSGADQVVDVMDWFSFASGQVPRLTESYFGVSQEVRTSTQGASFPLLPLAD